MYFSLNAILTVLLVAMMFSRNSRSMQNITISHLICHVARVIDDLLSFQSRPKFYYTNYRSRVHCWSFFVVAIVVFKTVVQRFQKTRTDIHDTTRLRAGCSIS